MLKKILLGAISITLLSIVALGIVSASPNSQSSENSDSFTFLIVALSDAESAGALTDDFNAHLSDYIIETLIIPYTYESMDEVKERLSKEGQSSFDLLVATLNDANDKGLIPELLIVTLSNLLIEEVIAPGSNETPLQIRERLSAQPTPTPTPIFTATPLPMTVSAVVKNVEKSVILVESSEGLGTGFIIDASGRAITNAHVVGRDEKVFVYMHDDSVYEADVLGIDEIADLAVIRLPSNRLLHPVPMGDSSLVNVGDEVIAMGYPLGLKTISAGVVSNKRAFDNVEYIQTDAAINPGNSGGPLLNISGHVIGVNTFKYEETASGRPVDNIGFAIAINEAKARLDALTAGMNELDLAPTPVPEVEGGWMRYKNGEYGYSLDVPPAWSFTTEFEDEKYAHFQSSDGQALAEARAYDVPEWFSLRIFAEDRKRALELAAASESTNLLEISEFKRVDDTQDEYFQISYRYQPTSEDCVSDVEERLYLSSSHPAKRYGFGVAVSVCEDSLDDHVFDRAAMMDTFLEWDMYASSAFGYSVNIAPAWTLNTVIEAGAVSVITPRYGGGSFVVEAYDLSDSSPTFEEFARWREGRLYGEAEIWNEFEPHFVNRMMKQVGDREAYVTAYTARKSSQHCLAGYIDLIALSSYYPDNQTGFIVFTGVCLFLMDDLGEDRLEMLDSFRY